MSDYFEGIAVKRLSKVETRPKASNQHEFNGTAELKLLLGDADRRNIPARFIWLGTEQEGVSSDSNITWYDARRNHPLRTEYRLYYPSNEVTQLMAEGDSLFITLCRDGSIMVMVVASGSILKDQLLWLFGVEQQPGFDFMVSELQNRKSLQLDFAARYILDELGVEFEEPVSHELDELVEQFGLKFPSTRQFSELARQSLSHISPMEDDPDEVLWQWIDREEALFRRLERRIVSKRLELGFCGSDGADVDGFVKFSLSVQNRRKARVGHSLENHLEALFVARDILHTRGATTENGYKPDFLFPSIDDYRDTNFPLERLTMLGSKSTLKDRWRQVLTEAERIPGKHLFTLQPALSENQTNQMKVENVQLVLPRPLHLTYTEDQQRQLMDLNSFLELVLNRQNR